MPQTQTLNWETLLSSNKIEIQHVDFALNNIDSAPKLPYEFVYKQFSDKVYSPEAIAISGSGGVIGAILSIKYANNISYFITTEDVLKATQTSPLFLAKYALDKLSKIYPNTDIIVLRINDFDKIKMLLKTGGIYISGLPYEIIIQISQLAGFGKLWHYSPTYKKFYVF
ncbi:MAG: hypothetical protein RXQ80_08440 [Sulfolobaceae archaeon]